MAAVAKELLLLLLELHQSMDDDTEAAAEAGVAAAEQSGSMRRVESDLALTYPWKRLVIKRAVQEASKEEERERKREKQKKVWFYGIDKPRGKWPKNSGSPRKHSYCLNKQGCNTLAIRVKSGFMTRALLAR